MDSNDLQLIASETNKFKFKRTFLGGSFQHSHDIGDLQCKRSCRFSARHATGFLFFFCFLFHLLLERRGVSCVVFDEQLFVWVRSVLESRTAFPAVVLARLNFGLRPITVVVDSCAVLVCSSHCQLLREMVLAASSRGLAISEIAGFVRQMVLGCEFFGHSFHAHTAHICRKPSVLLDREIKSSIACGGFDFSWPRIHLGVP